MTKKDYEKVANAIRRARFAAGKEDKEAQDTISLCVTAIGADLADDNPRFDFDKFVQACRI